MKSRKISLLRFVFETSNNMILQRAILIFQVLRISASSAHYINEFDLKNGHSSYRIDRVSSSRTLKNILPKSSETMKFTQAFLLVCLVLVGVKLKSSGEKV